MSDPSRSSPGPRWVAAPLALATALASLAALAAAGQGGWAGDPVAGIEFCECAPAGALIRQPVNTWSNLGFVLCGLVIGVRSDLDRRGGAGAANPLTRGALAGSLFAVVTALLGPGSMALHASMTRWGAALDVLSMFFFVGLALAYGAYRLARLRAGVFVGLLAALDLGLIAALWVPERLNVFMALVALAIVVEVTSPWLRPDLRRDRRWLYATLACFGLGVAIWIPSLTGGPLCDPASPWQGHAAWHLLCAGAAGALYAYHRSERLVVPAAGSGAGEG